MNKTVLVLILILSGVLLVGAGYIMVGGNLEGFNPESSRTVEKSYVCRDKVTAIEVRETSGRVAVRRGMTKTVEVSYFDGEKEPRYDIVEENGRFSITRKNKINFMFFNFDFTENLMTVTVPADFNGTLAVDTSSGRIEVSDISGQEITVGNTSGRIDLSNVTGKEIKVSNTSGKITLSGVKSETDLTVSNTSGALALSKVEAGGSIAADTTSGGISLEGLKAGGDVSLTASSGSIKGTIDGKESDYSISAHVTSGSNNLTDSNSGKQKLDVETTSGSIEIDFIG